MDPILPRIHKPSKQLQWRAKLRNGAAPWGVTYCDSSSVTTASSVGCSSGAEDPWPASRDKVGGSTSSGCDKCGGDTSRGCDKGGGDTSRGCDKGGGDTSRGCGKGGGNTSRGCDKSGSCTSGGVAEQKQIDMPCFFTTIPRFEPVPADGKIRTKPFLDACRSLLPFFDLMSSAFKPVKSDIQGNISKLESRYSLDPEMYVTLDVIVTRQRAEDKQLSPCAVESLLWLKRGLEFTVLFLRGITDTKKESLVPVAVSAYEKALKTYHGWILQKCITAILHATPNKKDFLRYAYEAQAPAAGDHCDPADEGDFRNMILDELSDYLSPFELNVAAVSAMFTDCGVDDTSYRA